MFEILIVILNFIAKILKRRRLRRQDETTNKYELKKGNQSSLKFPELKGSDNLTIFFPARLLIAKLLVSIFLDF